jgi:isoleucyl-tRNA synthetase
MSLYPDAQNSQIIILKIMTSEFNNLNLLSQISESYKTHSREYINSVWSIFSKLKK